MSATPPRVLSIAGSDSGGGAGIQADLKAIARCGCHGMTAITAITAQNTVAVESVVALPDGAIAAQVEAVVADIGVDAVKVGMLGSVDTIDEVADVIARLPGVPVVVDPVMVSESGARLLHEEAVAALVGRVVPLASVVTPNVPEARVLAAGRHGGGMEVEGGDARIEDLSAEQLASEVLALGPAAVVVTGGHREEVTDVYLDRDGPAVAIPGERHAGGAAHGSGCTHSSALAAALATGFAPLEAARTARLVAGEAVRDGLRGLGAGNGPVDVLGVSARSLPDRAP